ncbi:peptidoglycan DD-metalloendopeptidase family protein [Parafrankia discariae]|uniref:peptidoglycan DD-metalloendopeptidase family protein n=1 Tax=Parafrankia discariae TaxID=365528 RepID=UPI00039B734F|nr:peptidoglycan DD-metalloendopeptidase family protein [Parafrankia discariae]
MPHPPRFDPRWLVIPALALMIALGCPGRLPVRGSFGAGVPDMLTAPVASTPPATAAIPAPPTSPVAMASGSSADSPATTVAIPRAASSAPAAPVAPVAGAVSPSGLTFAAPAAPTAGTPVPVPVPAPDGGRSWRWPLPEPVVVAGIFRAPAQPYGPGHRGVDLRSEPGAEVRAARSGVVGFVGWVGDRWVVTVVHGALRTTYEPVRPLVRAGQPVSDGDRLGLLEAGHPGCPGAACLHWGVLRGSEYLDPLSFFRRVPPRLLPLGD